MTIKDIEKALRNQAPGDFISRKEIATALGYKDPHRVDRFLEGLVKIGSKYFIGDVAERLISAAK